MNQILIECKGISTDIFSLPPFTLQKGETIGIYIGNNDNYFLAQQYLTAIFTGKTQYKNTIVRNNFTFVDYFREVKWRRLFFPITVGEYLKKHSDVSNPYSQKIYEEVWINKRMNVNALPWIQKKLLRLYSELSKKENVIIDFAGLDKQGTAMISEIIRNEVEKGSSAILFDIFSDLENSCDQYIKIDWKDNRNYKPVYHFPEEEESL